MIEERLGLTQPLKRLAFEYLTKGIGEFDLTGSIYDKVVVELLYPWMENPTCENEYGGGIKISFFSNGHRVRWVEFGVRHIGGGGDPAIHSV